VNDIDLKRKKVAGIVKLVIGAVAIAILAPTIMLLVKGLVGIGIAGLVALAIVNFAPVISMKFANWKIKAIVAEAKGNPIETMISVAHARQDKLLEAKNAIANLSTQIKNFRDKLAGFKQQWPDQSDVFEKNAANMEAVLKKWQDNYRIADGALSQYWKEIDKCQAVNAMAIEMQKLNNMAQMDSDKLLEELKSKTAIDAVSENMNHAMSQLETSLLTEVPGKVITPQTASLLSNDPSQVVDFHSIKVAKEA
jgi:hypothetical protein